MGRNRVLLLGVIVAGAAAIFAAPSREIVKTSRPAELRKPVSEFPQSSPAPVSIVEQYRAAKERRDWREMKRLRAMADTDFDRPAELTLDDDPAHFRFHAESIRGSAHLASILQNDPRSDVRMAAALALGRHGVPEVLPHLEAIEGDLADFVLVKMHLRGLIAFPERRLAGLSAENRALFRGEALPEEQNRDE